MTITDNRTPNFNLPLTDRDNTLAADQARINQALVLIDTRLQEIVNQTQSPDAATLGGEDLAFVLALANVTGVLPVSKGGTGATDAAGARTALGFDAAWDAKFAAALDALPEQLDTLAEMTAAIQGNESVGAALNAAIAALQSGKADASHTHNASDIDAGTLSNARLDIAAQAAAEAGTGNGLMTSERTAQAIAALASGGGIVVQRQIFTSSGTWTKPAGLLYADIEVVGGGGAGAGYYGGPNHGGGGGGYARVIEAAADLGSTETVTVGAASGTSSFGSHASATGGSTGYTENSGGGTGGVGTASGGFVARGSDGGLASIYTGTYFVGGTGGGSFLGGAGKGGAWSGSAGGANTGGGGGGGGSNGGPGGAGGTGVVIVTEYISA